MNARRRLPWFPGPGVRLSAAELPPEGDANPGPKWVNVALEGIYKGHPMYPVVNLRRPVLETLVANLHQHPSFKAGLNGEGTARVVPYDYEHTSEMDPTKGSIPQKGTPAPAWVLDLQIRDAADGTAQLWALTEFLKTGLEDVRSGGYEYTSVAVWKNSKDPVSGKEIGPVLTSIAFTNHPFVQGLVSMGESLAASVSIWGEAESPEEAIVGLRDIFGLDPEATAESVGAELLQLQTMVANDAAPPWIDTDMMMGNIRSLLGLRVLADTQEIFAEAVRMLDALVTVGGSAETQSGPGDAPMPAPDAAALTARLATILGCKDAEPYILAAAEKSVKESTDGQDAVSQLLALFDSKDFNDLLTKATKCIADAKRAEGLTTQLSEALGKVKQVNESDADVEGEAVAASLTGTDKVLFKRLLPGIQSQRRGCINADGTVDAVKLAQFRKDYPLSDNERQYLTRRIVAGPNGLQLGSSASGAPEAPDTHPILNSSREPINPDEPDPNSPDALIASFPGRNRVERAVAYLCNTRKGFDKQERSEQIRQAGQWVRQPVAQQ